MASLLRRLKKLNRMSGRIPADWQAVATRADRLGEMNRFGAVVIGSGIGGLATAAYLARHGFRVDVLEKHNKPGGYATNFRRKGFTFEVSLHTMTVNQNATYDIIKSLGVLDRVKFNPLPEYHRVVAPDIDLTFPFADSEGYKARLKEIFPDETRAIDAMVDELTGVSDEIYLLEKKAGKFLSFLFPLHFPRMWKTRGKTLEELMSKHTENSDLITMVGMLWQYYGLPPSRVAGFFYAAGTGDYIKKGGFYPEGSSQAISNALVDFIRECGGEVHFGTNAERIIVENGIACGVEASGGIRLLDRTVVSNASPHHTFWELMDPSLLPDYYTEQLSTWAASESSLTVWLGLSEDITNRIHEAEIFLLSTLDTDADYAACLASDPERAGFVINIYNNMASGFAPDGKSAMSITFLCGYEPWRRFEDDYFSGRKTAYQAEKDRVARAVVERVERALLPGLSDIIEVMEVGTPLTNRRYTGNPGGAIYGYAMGTDNSFLNRNDSRTPIRNLYLASAWGTPGGGFTGCFRGAQQTWRCIIEDWERSV
jgi:prolycopene isomerase